MRHLFETIKCLAKPTYFALKMRQTWSRMHIYLFMQSSIEVGIFFFHLKQKLRVRKGNDSHYTYGYHFCLWSKCLLVINIMLGKGALGHKMSFVAFKWSICFCVDLIYTFTSMKQDPLCGFYVKNHILPVQLSNNDDENQFL